METGSLGRRARSSASTSSGADVLFAELAQGQLCFLGIAVADDRGHEVAGLTFAAGDHQHPHIRFAREDVDIVRLESRGGRRCIAPCGRGRSA